MSADFWNLSGSEAENTNFLEVRQELRLSIESVCSTFIVRLYFFYSSPLNLCFLFKVWDGPHLASVRLSKTYKFSLHTSSQNSAWLSPSLLMRSAAMSLKLPPSASDSWVSLLSMAHPCQDKTASRSLTPPMPWVNCIETLQTLTMIKRTCWKHGLKENWLSVNISFSQPISEAVYQWRHIHVWFQPGLLQGGLWLESQAHRSAFRGLALLSPAEWKNANCGDCDGDSRTKSRRKDQTCGFMLV